MQPAFILLTHHKCASTWLIRYMREFCGLNGLRLDSTHYSQKELDRACDILIWQNASYEFISERVDGALHLIRSPFDIVVSAYHSHKKTHPVDGWPELVRQREVLRNCDDIDGFYLTLSFLERDDFYNGAVGPLHALRHWDFEDRRYATLRMEDVVLEPETHLGGVLQSAFQGSVLPPADEHTFARMTGRQVGEVDDQSHYRSGKSDQWKETLPKPLVEYMRRHYAEILRNFYSHALAA